MYATERQDRIRRLIQLQGRVSVLGLAEDFDVTTETVRRDLDALEKAGLLRRVHGGAVALDRASTSEPSVDERSTLHTAQKARIGERALAVIGESFQGSLFIDAGTTTEAFSRALRGALSEGSAEVVTHAVPIAQVLGSKDGPALTIIGGRVRGATAAAVGAQTLSAIDALRPDIAVIGTNGISAGFGLSTPDPEEAAVKTAIVRAARRVIVLADANKFDREYLVRFALLSDIDVLVTDEAPGEELAAALERNGVEVVLA